MAKSDFTYQFVQSIEPMHIIVWIVVGTIVIAAALAPIVLFFKIWGMTNDVAEMKNAMKEWLEIEHPVIKEERETKSNADKLTS